MAAEVLRIGIEWMASKRCLHRFMAQTGSMDTIRILLFNQCNGLKSFFRFYAVYVEGAVGYDVAKLSSSCHTWWLQRHYDVTWWHNDVLTISSDVIVVMVIMRAHLPSMKLCMPFIKMSMLLIMMLRMSVTASMNACTFSIPSTPLSPSFRQQTI